MRYFLKTLAIVIFIAGTVFAEEQKYSGGQAIILDLEGGFLKSYKISFENKQYVPYELENGNFQIILPIGIESKEDEDITVLKKFMGIKYKTEIIQQKIGPRKIKVVHLRSGDEKMRDKSPQIEEQKIEVSNSLEYKSNIKFWSSNFIMPLNTRISTEFAVLRKGKKYNYYHKGVDLAAKKGTEVKAINDGKVILSAENLNVYGNAMVIDHGQGLISCYFHLNKLQKGKDEEVKKGEIIAEVGSTGWSSGPHLHFGIYVQGEAIDPLWWITHTKKLYNTTEN